MHEMGIATEILRIVEASVPANMVGAAVRRVNLKIGRLSTIVPESLRFCFGIVAENTPVAGAELIIKEVPVDARCAACGKQWTIEKPDFICPDCNSPNVEMLSGRELDIESIELDDPDAAE